MRRKENTDFFLRYAKCKGRVRRNIQGRMVTLTRNNETRGDQGVTFGDKLHENDAKAQNRKKMKTKIKEYNVRGYKVKGWVKMWDRQ